MSSSGYIPAPQAMLPTVLSRHATHLHPGWQSPAHVACRDYRGGRQPACRASRSLQNQRSPAASLILVAA